MRENIDGIIDIKSISGSIAISEAKNTKIILPNEKNTGQRYDIVYFVILLRKYGIHIFASKYTGIKKNAYDKQENKTHKTIECNFN